MPKPSDSRPLCQAGKPSWIEDGTMCRAESSTQVPIGLGLQTFLPEGSGVLRELTKKWQCDDDVRSEIVRVARKYVGSTNWREDKDRVVKCSRFVDDVLGEVFHGALGHGLQKPPRIGGWRGLLAHMLEVHTERPKVHELGTKLRAGRNYPPLAGNWASSWIDIPMWKIVEEGPPAAQPGDIVSESILYWDASGHVGIVVGLGETASADSTATPPGTITISNYGFRAEDDSHEHGHAKDCTIRRFTCPYSLPPRS
jgi:hypothetical protein